MKEFYEMTDKELGEMKARFEAVQGTNGYVHLFLDQVEREIEQRKELEAQTNAAE